MYALFTKEVNAFFSGITGYLVIGVFLIINGLFLWVFQGNFNILDYGFASLSPFFQIAPWILIFLIPAVTMRSFSEEKKQGTMELLLTKPLKPMTLVLGKYLGNLFVVILALIPTLLYVYSLYRLGAVPGNFDGGEILGSYIGLFLLSAVFTAIGLLSSTLTGNQIVAFIIAVLGCFLSFFAFEGIAHLQLFGSEIYALEYLGISFHYESISRGVIDTRDIVYFISLAALCLGLAGTHLKTAAR